MYLLFIFYAHIEEIYIVSWPEALLRKGVHVEAQSCEAAVLYFILSRGESSCPRRKSCRKTNCHSRPATSANVSNLYIVESLSQFADSSLLGLLHILAFGCCYISLCTSHKIKTLFHIKRHFISYQQHSM